MFFILTEPVNGPVDSLVGFFSSEKLAGEYLEKQGRMVGWEKSIGRWWRNKLNHRARIFDTSDSTDHWHW